MKVKLTLMRSRVLLRAILTLLRNLERFKGEIKCNKLIIVDNLEIILNILKK
jgi:hypothetical protein